MTFRSLFTRTGEGLRRRKRYTQFLILFSFFITFLLTRIITHLQKLGLLPSQHHSPYIHHLVPGIFLLILSGYVGLSFHMHVRLRHVMAILFGIGAALTIDEFALWLYLKDVYWERQGRASIDAIIILTVVFILGLLITEAHDYYSARKHKKR